MVLGAQELHRRFQNVPKNVRVEVKIEMERMAEEIVGDMRRLAPLPEIARAIKWRWGGEGEEGALIISSIRGGSHHGNAFGKMVITIYVDRREAWFAHLFEFGTSERYHESGRHVGRIEDSPFFWPAFRANRAWVKRRLSAAVRRALKKS